MEASPFRVASRQVGNRQPGVVDAAVIDKNNLEIFRDRGNRHRKALYEFDQRRCALVVDRCYDGYLRHGLATHRCRGGSACDEIASLQGASHQDYPVLFITCSPFAMELLQAIVLPLLS